MPRIRDAKDISSRTATQAPTGAIDIAMPNHKCDKDVKRLAKEYPKTKPAIKEIKRISKPGRRIYAKADSISKIQNGLGLAIVSTSIGIMSDNDARMKNVGGEIICKVY